MDLQNDVYLIGRCLLKPLDADAHALNVNRGAPLPALAGK